MWLNTKPLLSDAEKCSLLISCLRSNALTAAQVICELHEKTKGAITYEELHTQLRQYFTDIAEKPRLKSEILSIQQSQYATIEEFTQRFLVIATGLQWEDDSTTTLFLEALDAPLRRCILSHADQPDSLVELIRMATKIHHSIGSERRSTPRPTQQQQQGRALSHHPTHASTQRTNTSSSSYAPQSSASAPQARVKLNDELRAQLSAAGKCFYCRQAGHIMRSCPSRPARPNFAAAITPTVASIASSVEGNDAPYQSQGDC